MYQIDTARPVVHGSVGPGHCSTQNRCSPLQCIGSVQCNVQCAVEQTLQPDLDSTSMSRQVDCGLSAVYCGVETE